MKLIEVTFIKNPLARFRLAYSAGQSGLVTPEMAKKLEKEGYIEPLPKAKPKLAKKKAEN